MRFHGLLASPLAKLPSLYAVLSTRKRTRAHVCLLGGGEIAVEGDARCRRGENRMKKCELTERNMLNCYYWCDCMWTAPRENVVPYSQGDWK